MIEITVHVDDEALSAAQRALRTRDVATTVNEALRRAGESPTISDGIDLLRSGALADAADPEVMRSAWR